MDKFDLEKALAGDKVVTRDGREVTQFHVFNHTNDPILYGYDVDNDHVEQWFVAGNYHKGTNECGGDLFMAPKKLSGFINIYASRYCESPIHATREVADNESNKTTRLACIDLSQFEEGHGL